ncbi:unnamed protein product [Gongylonema pulchrum]|uniref:Ephrin RBD domain-containing protein n=1 Tax=Gongylonema pulchrum TaxID=637853 RepID=A0A183CXH7_9BILA|nr:unnamed protein product [Gongylonema pulchrum]
MAISEGSTISHQTGFMAHMHCGRSFKLPIVYQSYRTSTGCKDGNKITSPAAAAADNNDYSVTVAVRPTTTAMLTTARSSLALMTFVAAVIIQRTQTSSFPEDPDSFLEILFDKSEYLISIYLKSPLSENRVVTSWKRKQPQCLTAANDGKPFVSNQFSIATADTNLQKLKMSTASPSTLFSISPVSAHASPTTQHPSSSFIKESTETTGGVEDICTMDQPQGRFCGFQIKIAYNRDYLIK